MSEQWEFYECAVDDQRAFISVDLGVAEQAPIAEAPILMRVTVPLLAPRPDGLPDASEHDRLAAIEDQLEEAFAACGAVYVGRAAYGGARRHFCYGPSESDAEAAFLAVRHAVGDRELAGGSVEDPEWTEYLDFLYPNALAWHYIQDRRVLDSLSKRGDKLTTARRIDHHADFASAAAAAEFAAAVRADGFRVEAEQETDASPDASPDGSRSERPFHVHFSHELEPFKIFAVTIELVKSAESLGGTYDGWGCSVVADD